MNEENITFEEALKEAQRKGIAETNPILDVSGSDSACKLLLFDKQFNGNRAYAYRYTYKRN